MDSSFMSSFGGATPYGAMIQGATQLGMAALKPVATTSQVDGTYGFDTSGGFTLNIGAGRAESTATKTTLPTAAQAAQVAAAGIGGLLASPVFVIAVGMGLYLYLKHK
jgi:hypothetical protein